MRKYLFVLLALTLLLSACGGELEILRLATTTSTEDSGLLEVILPAFEEAYNAEVQVVAAGTGQAIALGEAGDADVILVHARSREEAFIEAGHGAARYDVMYNDFVIVGPPADPANIRGLTLASEALAAIAAAGANGEATAKAAFASRGDDSGTHTKERSLWEAAGLPADPEAAWFKSLGQGMGNTLQFANETGAYTLTDRATFLALQENLPALELLVGGATIDENRDPALLNPYGVIPVNPDKGNINEELAADFVEWLTSLETQEAIAEFGRDTFGQPLFYPDSEAWRNR